ARARALLPGRARARARLERELHDDAARAALGLARRLGADAVLREAFAGGLSLLLRWRGAGDRLGVLDQLGELIELLVHRLGQLRLLLAQLQRHRRAGEQVHRAGGRE